MYFPTNYHNSDSDASFIETLSEFDALLMSVFYDNVIIAGDFNVDFSHNNCRILSITEFMNTRKLLCVDLNYPINFTYASDNGRAHSRPDHILTSVNFSDCISDVAAVHSADNFSDHLPLTFSLVADIPISGSSSTEQSISDLEALTKVCWHKITPVHTDHYLETLSKLLPRSLSF